MLDCKLRWYDEDGSGQSRAARTDLTLTNQK